MSCKHLKFFKERKPRCWFFNDLMTVLETEQLCKILPNELRMLICEMSIGFPVYCLGARKAEINENGIQNRRDMKCLVHKWSSEPPLHDNWTCYPCLDFLRKSNPKVWRERKGSKCRDNFGIIPPRFQKTSWMKKKTISKEQRHLSEEYKNQLVIKLSFGEILIRRNIEYQDFFTESFSSASKDSVVPTM